MPRTGQHRQPRLNVDQHVRSFGDKRAVYSAFTAKLSGLLRELVESDGIKFHVIESRTKSIESFQEKIRRKKQNYSHPLEEIKDLVGLRIIVYYLEDIESVSRLLEREFRIDEQSSLDKGQLLKPNEFGYRSVHYIVSLPDSRRDLLEWRAFAQISAEVQVRTVLQHAWASISHMLDYKHEEEVPSPLRRKLFRLAGLLELSDEEFSGLRRSEQEFSGNIRKELDRGEKDLELNSISLAAYFNDSNSLSFIINAARKAGFEVFGSNEDISELISLCSHLSINTIGQLADEISASKVWIRNYLKALLRSDGGEYWIPDEGWAVDPPFLVELLVIRQHADELTPEYLVEQGWNEQTAKKTLKVAHDFGPGS